MGALDEISSLILYMSSVGQQKSHHFRLLEDSSLNLALFS